MLSQLNFRIFCFVVLRNCFGFWAKDLILIFTLFVVIKPAESCGIQRIWHGRLDLFGHRYSWLVNSFVLRGFAQIVIKSTTLEVCFSLLLTSIEFDLAHDEIFFV